ncbi:putative polyketide synthase [Burkholderia pseudomallei MSHR5608]|nr:putative polyketide synthase [Burkholderia pseudomallei MSHR5608]
MSSARPSARAYDSTASCTTSLNRSALRLLLYSPSTSAMLEPGNITSVARRLPPRSSGSARRQTCASRIGTRRSSSCHASACRSQSCQTCGAAARPASVSDQDGASPAPSRAR